MRKGQYDRFIFVPPEGGYTETVYYVAADFCGWTKELDRTDHYDFQKEVAHDEGLRDRAFEDRWC